MAAAAAAAADVTVVQAGEVVEIGELDPHHIMTPGVFVDYIIDGYRASTKLYR